VQRLVRVLSDPEPQGRPLPTIFPSLAAMGGNFNMAEVSMLAGRSGAGKTALSLWHAYKWVKDHGLRGLFFSADGRRLAVASRVVSMSSGIPTKEAKARLMDQDLSLAPYLEETQGLEWSFHSDLSYDHVDLEVAAFGEKWGHMPAFIVLDNLTDVEEQSDDEYRSMRRILVDLNKMAGATDAHVMVLHHVAEGAKENPCPARKEIHGKIDRKQTLILTTAQAKNGKQPVAVVKTREAAFDSSGEKATFLGFEGATMRYQDLGYVPPLEAAA
jgi:hypothetical protein